MGKHAAANSGSERGLEGAPKNTRLVLMLFGIALLVVVVDQLSKQWALGALSENEAVPLIGRFIMLQLTFNPGAAFGMASGSTWIFTLIAVVVVIAVVRLARNLHSPAWALMLGLLLGGAIGNLIDRLFRDPGFPQGHVVDFLNYGGLFIGNIADIAIVVAALGIALLAFVSGDRQAPGVAAGEPSDG